MLRHPVELFRSMWDFLNLEKRYQVRDLEEYACAAKTGVRSDRATGNFHVGRNQMMWDLGLEPIDFDNYYGIKSRKEK